MVFRQNLKPKNTVRHSYTTVSRRSTTFFRIFDPPPTVIEVSNDYIKRNNVLIEFIKEAFEEIGNKEDTVLLIYAFELCRALGYDTRLL